MSSSDTKSPGNVNSGELAAQLMQNPQILQSLQSKLDGMIGTTSGYVQSLPPVVKRRLKALKKLQFESSKVEVKFYEEVHRLECKYSAEYEPLFQKRKNIINGTLEPTGDECDWPSEEEDEEEDGEKKVKAIEKKDHTLTNDNQNAPKDKDSASGIPGFWSTVLHNAQLISEMIQDHDEPILDHLVDIVLKLSPTLAFTLEFHFSSNEYFTNAVLKKEYFLRSEVSEDDPFGFDGPEIYRCEGCSIDWKPSKNVTVKLVKKVQKHKGRGTKRTVTQTVPRDSFFNFFNPPKVAEGEEVDGETEELLTSDFEIGHFFRDQIIPRAVLYFTGEALEGEDDEDEEEEGEDEHLDGEDGGDEDEDADPEYKPPAGENPPDCKQQ